MHEERFTEASHLLLASVRLDLQQPSVCALLGAALILQPHGHGSPTAAPTLERIRHWEAKAPDYRDACIRLHGLGAPRCDSIAPNSVGGQGSCSTALYDSMREHLQWQASNPAADTSLRRAEAQHVMRNEGARAQRIKRLSDAWAELSADERLHWLRQHAPGEMQEAFHLQAYPQHIFNQWLGLPAMQNPMDAWVTQELLVNTGADAVVECGSYMGGNVLFLAGILDALAARRGQIAKIVSVDVDAETAAAQDWLAHYRHVEVTFLQGSSVDASILRQVKTLISGSRSVMVLLDSDHSKEHVKQELQQYAPLVSLGSYLLVQDANLNGHPVHDEFQSYGLGTSGPFEATYEFLQQAPEGSQFVIDRLPERMGYTHNPSGFLKRVHASTLQVKPDRVH